MCGRATVSNMGAPCAGGGRTKGHVQAHPPAMAPIYCQVRVGQPPCLPVAWVDSAAKQSGRAEPSHPPPRLLAPGASPRMRKGRGCWAREAVHVACLHRQSLGSPVAETAMRGAGVWGQREQGRITCTTSLASIQPLPLLLGDVPGTARVSEWGREGMPSGGTSPASSPRPTPPPTRYAWRPGLLSKQINNNNGCRLYLRFSTPYYNPIYCIICSFEKNLELSSSFSLSIHANSSAIYLHKQLTTGKFSISLHKLCIQFI